MELYVVFALAVRKKFACLFIFVLSETDKKIVTVVTVNIFCGNCFVRRVLVTQYLLPLLKNCNQRFYAAFLASARLVLL